MALRICWELNKIEMVEDTTKLPLYFFFLGTPLLYSSSFLPFSRTKVVYMYYQSCPVTSSVLDEANCYIWNHSCIVFYGAFLPGPSLLKRVSFSAVYAVQQSLQRYSFWKIPLPTRQREWVILFKCQVSISLDRLSASKGHGHSRSNSLSTLGLWITRSSTQALFHQATDDW